MTKETIDLILKLLYINPLTFYAYFPKGEDFKNFENQYIIRIGYFKNIRYVLRNSVR
jgi:hypothetical protein